jgi:hypothetical protein
VIDWATVEPGLCALVTSITGIACEHPDGKRSLVSPATGCVATSIVYAITPQGTDERQMLPAPDEDQPWANPWGGEPGDLIECVVGLREVTWRVKFEAYDATPGRAAQAHAERLRTRMSFSSSAAALEALGFGLLRAEPTTYVPEPRSQRTRPFAFVDFRLSVYDAEADTANPYKTIETVSPTFRKVE